MSITLWIIAYFLGGAVSNFMRGYTAPRASIAESMRSDWYRFLIWPLAFPTTVISFAAIVRMGEKA